MEREWEWKTGNGFREFSFFYRNSLYFALLDLALPQKQVCGCVYTSVKFMLAVQDQNHRTCIQISNTETIFMTQEFLVLVICIFLLCSSRPSPSYLHFKLLLILHFNLLKVLLLNFALINHKFWRRQREVRGWGKKQREPPGLLLNMD